MKGFKFILLGFLLSGCTTQMYVARTSFEDGDMTCLAQAYWYKTDYLIGSKADRVLTVASGGQRVAVQFQEREDGLVYVGEASRDVMVEGAAPAGREFVCGRVNGLAVLEKFAGNELSVTMHCRARLDELSVSRGYLPARVEPYRFTVHAEELFSFSGRMPEPPRPPTCAPRTAGNESVR